MAEYNVPSYNQVNFELTEYTVPEFDNMNFDILEEPIKKIYCFIGGVFKPVTSLKRRVSGSWVALSSIKVFKDSVWKTIEI